MSNINSVTPIAVRQSIPCCPTEVETLLGDASKAKERLNWLPQITLQEMIAKMIEADLLEARKSVLFKNSNLSS